MPQSRSACSSGMNFFLISQIIGSNDATGAVTAIYTAIRLIINNASCWNNNTLLQEVLLAVEMCKTIFHNANDSATAVVAISWLPAAVINLM